MIIVENSQKDINLDRNENEVNNRSEGKQDSAFNQLLQIQLLIQKHSGLRDLCK